MAAQPPDRALTLHELSRMAHAFDAPSYSEAAGARYPARAFVDFVRDEVSAAYIRPAGQPNRSRDGELRRAAGE
jgi:hypothetical protein